MEHIVNRSLFLIVVLIDFSSRSEGWYKNDVTTFEGSKIDIAISRFGISQIINGPCF